MKRDLLLIDLTKEIKAHRFKTLKALAARIGKSARFVGYDLKLVLIALQLITWQQWADCFPGRRRRIREVGERVTQREEACSRYARKKSLKKTYKRKTLN